MKLLILITLFATVCYVSSEVCSNVTTCKTTTCATSATHVHLECSEKHCTCMTDPQPCLVLADCDAGKRCIDTNGQRAIDHCLDGKCLCIVT